MLTLVTILDSLHRPNLTASEMVVTEVLQGRPYQCFVPKPVNPVIERRYVSEFEALDRRMFAGVDEEAFAKAVIASVLQDNGQALSGGLGDRLNGVEVATARAFKLKKVGLAELLELNSLLTRKPSTGFRKNAIWLGASHPAVAWHVGSPSAQLNMLVGGILKMASPSSLSPVTLTALVSLIRLLQVHPFSDGNGRTSRLYACWLIRQRLGPSPLFLTLLDALWHRAIFSIHGASVSIRDSGDWAPLFDHCLRVLPGRRAFI